MKEKQEKTFAEQVDDVLNGADTSSSHLEVLKETPPLLRMVGVPNLPILMTAKHVKTMTQSSGKDSANYHGLGVELIKRLPDIISDPIMIMDSLSRADSIVVVSRTVDKENRPIIGAIMLDGRGNDANGIEVSANILSSAYGKDYFISFIRRNIKRDSILYIDKEKSQELFKTPGIQFSDNLESLSFNTIIRKSRAFVNMQEQKNSKNTKKEGKNMNTDVNISPREKVQQIRDGMVKTLIDYIGKNPTNWQSGWVATGVPMNGKTKTPYRGLNSLYLALIGMEKGFSDPRWVTFNQAKDLGASVKRGEQSVPVVFFEFYDRATKRTYDSRTTKNMTDEEKKVYIKENVYAVLKYSRVFNAAQCENFPERSAEYKMPEEERAQQNALIETIIANSAAPIAYDGGNQAYYSPGTDSIHLPAIDAFKSMQDYYATALHEIAHSTGHETRLNRDMSGGKGSESYAKEELRAELACVFMQLEQGLQLEGKHIENHAAYLSSWMEAVKNDSSVFTKAAADAQKIADYVADHYLQSVNADVLESVAITEEENTEQKTAEFNPMADYLRAEQDKLETEQQTVIDTRLQENIKEWYISIYPTDAAGNDINARTTFKDLQDALNSGKDIYGTVLGINDSVIRERVFNRFAELTYTTYDSVYAAYMGDSTSQSERIEESKAKSIYLSAEEFAGLQRGFDILDKVKTYDKFSESTSEMVRKYAQVKRENPAEIVFYRIGDFYEVLGEDAKRAAQELELTLTGRDAGLSERIPMAGVPYHAIDEYSSKLAEKGIDVAIADGADIRHIKGNIPQNMPQITQNEQQKQVAPLRTELTNKTAWLKINMPDGTVGKEYGKNTLVKMPEGEFSHFAVFVPTKFLKQDSESGKWQLNVGASFTYRLNNDGREVELTGQELADSFNGMQLNKDAVRVAPSWKNAQALANIAKNVPGEMRAIPNWCVFRTRLNPEKGKRDKFLLSAKDGHWVKVNEPDRWTDFETAMQYAKANNCEGLSFVLDGKSGITCIDLDKCIDVDGNFNAVAKKLTDEIKGTYVEKSVSGNGVHIWLKDDVLKGKYKNSAITSDGELEVYDNDHIISITGNMLSDTNELGKCPMSTMNYLRGALGEKLQQTLLANRNARQGYQAGSDRDVVERIRRSKKGAEFDELYSGKGISGDRSRDDMKLANILAFFTDGDAAQMLRIIKESGLYRPEKPDDYYIHTIGKAIDTLTDRPKYGAATDADKGKNRGNDGAAH